MPNQAEAGDATYHLTLAASAELRRRSPEKSFYGIAKWLCENYRGSSVKTTRERAAVCIKTPT